MLGGSNARRSELLLGCRELWRHSGAHEQSAQMARARRLEARGDSPTVALSMAAAALQPVWAASNFVLSCPLDESRPQPSPGTGPR